MKITELIRFLQVALEEHGDLRCTYDNACDIAPAVTILDLHDNEKVVELNHWI